MKDTHNANGSDSGRNGGGRDHASRLRELIRHQRSVSDIGTSSNARTQSPPDSLHYPEPVAPPAYLPSQTTTSAEIVTVSSAKKSTPMEGDPPLILPPVIAMVTANTSGSGNIRKSNSFLKLMKRNRSISVSETTTTDSGDGCGGDGDCDDSASTPPVAVLIPPLPASPSSPPRKMWERQYRSFLRGKGLLSKATTTASRPPSLIARTQSGGSIGNSNHTNSNNNSPGSASTPPLPPSPRGGVFVRKIRGSSGILRNTSIGSNSDNSSSNNSSHPHHHGGSFFSVLSTHRRQGSSSKVNITNYATSNDPLDKSIRPSSMRKVKSHNELDYTMKNGTEKGLLCSATTTEVATTSTHDHSRTISDSDIMITSSSVTLSQQSITRQTAPDGVQTLAKAKVKSSSASPPSGASPSSVTFTTTGGGDGVTVTTIVPHGCSPPGTAPLATVVDAAVLAMNRSTNSTSTNNTNNAHSYNKNTSSHQLQTTQLYNPRFSSGSPSERNDNLTLSSSCPTKFASSPLFLRAVHEEDDYEEDYIDIAGLDDDADSLLHPSKRSHVQGSKQKHAPEPPLFLGPAGIMNPFSTLSGFSTGSGSAGNEQQQPQQQQQQQQQLQQSMMIAMIPFRPSSQRQQQQDNHCQPSSQQQEQQDNHYQRLALPIPPTLSQLQLPPPPTAAAVKPTTNAENMMDESISYSSSAIKKAFTEFHNSKSTGQDAVSAYLGDDPSTKGGKNRHHHNLFWAQRNQHYFSSTASSSTISSSIVQEEHQQQTMRINSSAQPVGDTTTHVEQIKLETPRPISIASQPLRPMTISSSKSHESLSLFIDNNNCTGIGIGIGDGPLLQNASQLLRQTTTFIARPTYSATATGGVGIDAITSTDHMHQHQHHAVVGGPTIPYLGTRQTGIIRTLDTVHENFTIHKTVRMLRPIQGVETWQTGRRYLIAPAALAACPPAVVSAYWGFGPKATTSNIKLSFQSAFEGAQPSCPLFGSILLGECLLSYRPIGPNNGGNLGGSSSSSTIQQWSAATLILRQNYLLEYDPNHDFAASCIPRGYIHLQHSECYANKDFSDALELRFYISPCAKADKRILLIRITNSNNRMTNANNVNYDGSVSVPISGDISQQAASVKHEDVTPEASNSESDIDSTSNDLLTANKARLTGSIRQQIEQEREHWIMCCNKAASLKIDDLYEFPTKKKQSLSSSTHNGDNHSMTRGHIVSDKGDNPGSSRSIKTDNVDDTDPSILGRGQYVTVRAARRRVPPGNRSNSSNAEDTGDPHSSSGVDRYDCALKIFEKNEFWRMVVKGRERNDTLVREASVQATLTVRAGNRIDSFLRIRGFFETTDHVVLELERLDGTDLFKYISQKGVLDEIEAADIMRDILQSLREMKRLGLAHRDIKPANILMCNGPLQSQLKKPNGQTSSLSYEEIEPPVKGATVKVADFGMATFAGVDGLVRGRCGTPGYVAPEIFTAGLHGGYGNKVDVFSAGVTLYVMLCGYEPFYGESDSELIAANKDASNLEFPGEDWSAISSEAKDLVRRMMDPNPNTRYSAKEALQHPWFGKTLRSSSCQQQQQPLPQPQPQQQQQQQQQLQLQNQDGVNVKTSPTERVEDIQQGQDSDDSISATKTVPPFPSCVLNGDGACIIS